MLPPITLTDSGIRYQSYPFWPASIYPGGVLPWDRVREIVPGGLPPEIRTVEGEVLFVRSDQKQELIAAAQQRRIPCIERVDIWSLLLEPFLDTEFDASTQAYTDAVLARHGISPDESAAIRDRFGSIMYAYNFGTGLWEWVHLGLYDLLAALRLAEGGIFKLRAIGGFKAVYWEAMQIAERGQQQAP